jgi:hypothetical protein
MRVLSLVPHDRDYRPVQSVLARAQSDYLQLTVYAELSGNADSMVAHAVRHVDAPLRLTPGLYRLRVRALGYQTVIDTLRVGAGEVWCATARLAPAVELEPVF